jgi:hypothetical protein
MSKYNQGGSRPNSSKPVPKKEMNKRNILDNLAKKKTKGLEKYAIEGVVSRATYLKYLREDADFAAEVDLLLRAAKEDLFDEVEERLIDSILDPEKQLTKNQVLPAIFFSKTQMKHRGYNEREEKKKEEESKEVNIQIVMPEPPKQIENIEDKDFEEVKLNKDE